MLLLSCPAVASLRLFLFIDSIVHIPLPPTTMAPARYAPLASNEHQVGEKDDYFSQDAARQPAQSVRGTCRLVALCIMLACSLSANGVFIYREYFRPWTLLQDLPTQYAGLRRNVPTEVKSHSDFDSLNRTVQDAAWDHVDIEPWNGFVALDEDYTVAQGLPHSQRWPWDLSKGVYIMTSSHELHCVHVLRELVNEDHDGVPEAERTWHYPHVTHCLNVLRESIMCNADDKPLYIGRLHQNVHEESPRAGTGTVKMCRDWNQLLKWSRERSACYKPVRWTDGSFAEIDRYKTCPDGARPWERVEGVDGVQVPGAR